MDMQATLLRSGGIEALARELGIPSAVAAAGAEALLPAVLGGLRKRGEEGLEALVAALEAMGGGGLAAQVMGPDPADPAGGIKVLEHVFLAPAVSRAVARHASAASRIEPEVLQRMLPLLAMLVGGYLSARARGSGEGAADEGLSQVRRLIAGNTAVNPLDAILGMASDGGGV